MTVRSRFQNSRSIVKESLETSKTRDSVSWLTTDEQALQISVVKEPTRDEIGIPIEEQLVVELLSR